MTHQDELTEPGHISTHDHNACHEKAIHIAEQLCSQREVRFTPIRREVLNLIWESHRAVKAYDLLDRIRPKFRTAKPATVYRALDFLLEQGLIHKLESLNAFIGCSYSDHRHELLLLTCVQCHEVEERLSKRVMEAITKELEQAAFTMYSKAIEIHGICCQCAPSRTVS